ncbi:hypothetical protein CO2235_U770047 [Cupriavidus oxalaticus]|uniref:Uncharacterized protein n=1 Tax=Cupriavidus oxalaticus TaxID=96344 RepID=A0A375FPH6_9BURK|nr:hypothetical protein CO2235_U770047 [Cupriavidus oxalaticus]
MIAAWWRRKLASEWGECAGRASHDGSAEPVKQCEAGSRPASPLDEGGRLRRLRRTTP